jgi:hypothetical protein
MSLASIAISLAPLAADLAGKILNMKKDGKSEKNLQERIEKIENYEIEQAKLIKKLTHKVEYLQVQQKKLKRMAIAAFIFGILALSVAAGVLLLNSEI